MHTSQFGSNSSANNFLNGMDKFRHMCPSYSGSQLDNPRRCYGYKGNSSQLFKKLGGHPKMKSFFRHIAADIETNPNKQLPERTVSHNNNPHVFDPTTGFDKKENLREGYEEGYGKISHANLAHRIPITQNLNPTKRTDGSSTKQGPTPNETADEDSNLPVCSLTEQNLLLYNKYKPPLKGDFRTIVRTWLQKSAA